jgi:hypothetical protein
MPKSYQDELQDAFSRWESQGFRDIKDWITKGDSTKYRGGRKSFGDRLLKPRNVIKDIGRASTFEDAENIQKEISGFDFPIAGTDTEDDIKSFQSKVEESKGVLEDAKRSENREELKGLQKQASKVEFEKETVKTTVKEKRREITSRDIETGTTIEGVEIIDVTDLTGLKQEKTNKLKEIESMQRAEVLDRIVEELMLSQNISEGEAIKVVRREKLVTAELGDPRYTF